MAKPVILTVDDEPQVLGAVERDLRRQYGGSYRITKAGSGAEALRTLQELKTRDAPVALLLVDQRMPQMSGTELLVEAAKLYPEARKVLLTAYADTNAAIESINTIGLDYYLMKPWDPPEQHLYPVLDDLLGEWTTTATVAYEGIRVYGVLWSPQTYVVKEFLARNHVPYQWLDVDVDPVARELATRVGGDRLPVVFFPDGRTLAAPDVATLAETIGLSTKPSQSFYDLVILGGGPAGLAAAVYGGSEGLRTIVIEKKAPGGQAGSSSFIENYLGFPKGLSGADLARRAATQAQRFGVEMVTGAAVRIERDDPYRTIVLEDGTRFGCHAVVIATGMTTRQIEEPSIAALTGRGIYYGASLTEASAHRGRDIAIVGAANSAGQGALFFTRFARRVTMLVRGDSLDKSMSHYLIKQLEATSNLEVLLDTQLCGAHGTDRLEGITIEAAGARRRLDVAAMFIFIGAVPHAEVVCDLVARDEAGFLLTGPDLMSEGRRPSGWTPKRDPFLLETSVPGIFAAGDVRHGSTKRVATAVGEGANAVAMVHQYLKTV